MKAIFGVFLLLLFSCGFTPWTVHTGRDVASTLDEAPLIFNPEQFQAKVNDLYSYVVLQERFTKLSVSDKAKAFHEARLHIIKSEILRLKMEINNLITSKEVEARPILEDFLTQSPLHRYALESHLKEDPHTSTPSSERWLKEYDRLIQSSRFKIQEKSIEHKAHILATRQLFTHNSHCTDDSISMRDKAGSRCSLK